jgi:hypothetical protein
MVKMSHSFGKADPPKRVAYTVSDDWTSARRGNKKLRLCALGTALDRPRETIPSTFDQQLEAAIGSGTNWVEVARRLPKPRTSQKLDAPKPLDRQEDIRPEWASPDPANSSGAISDYEMQILLLEQQNKKRLLMSRTSQDLNMPKPLDPQIPARPEWGAREPMSSDAALSDHQMQMMSLEQQNKKRLLMPRDSPLLDARPISHLLPQASRIAKDTTSTRLCLARRIATYTRLLQASAIATDLRLPSYRT